MDANRYGERRLPTISWNEEDLDKIFKYPCYAFQRGNIIFTTTPPPPLPREEGAEKRGRSASIATAGCDAARPAGQKAHSDADFCEVCRGIRSPNFARRAQTFTTHFCTRVPAKKQIVSDSSFSSDQRSKSTGSTSTSSMATRDVSDKSQGHVSRLSTFLRAKCGRQKFFSESESSGSAASTDRSHWAPWRRRSSQQCPDGCSTASWTDSSAGAASTASSLFAGVSACSSYPSSTGSWSLAAGDTSTCCGCGSASCAASSLERAMLTSAADTASSCSSVSTDGWSVRRGLRRRTRDLRNARRRAAWSSTNEDEPTGSESDEDASDGSEMGWSFGSLYAGRPQRSGDSLDAVTPFVANAGRQLDVLEKFGNIVGTLRKPGHHVGPSKNADCLCHNCRTYFANKS